MIESIELGILCLDYIDIWYEGGVVEITQREKNLENGKKYMKI